MPVAERFGFAPAPLEQIRAVISEDDLAPKKMLVKPLIIQAEPKTTHSIRWRIISFGLTMRWGLDVEVAQGRSGLVFRGVQVGKACVRRLQWTMPQRLDRLRKNDVF